MMLPLLIPPSPGDLPEGVRRLEERLTAVRKATSLQPFEFSKPAHKRADGTAGCGWGGVNEIEG